MARQQRISSSVQVLGADEIERAVRQFGEAFVGDALKDAAELGIRPIEEEAKRNAGDISSRLAGGIVKETKAAGASVKLTLGPSPDFFWGLYFEFGGKAHGIDADEKKVLASSDQVFGKHVDHPGIQERPWLQPAFDSRVEDARTIIEKYVRDRIEEAGRR